MDGLALILLQQKLERHIHRHRQGKIVMDGLALILLQQKLERHIRRRRQKERKMIETLLHTCAIDERHKKEKRKKRIRRYYSKKHITFPESKSEREKLECPYCGNQDQDIIEKQDDRIYNMDYMKGKFINGLPATWCFCANCRGYFSWILGQGIQLDYYARGD